MIFLKGGIWTAAAVHTAVMRNLLSFFLGILSDLLYVFVCFALFLDRAVTFVWDAPLRRRTGGVIHALARSRAASAALIFIPCFLLPFSLLTQKGVLILAGDKPLGFVQDADMLSGTVQELEASASAASGETYSLPFSLSTRSMRAPLCEFLDENALRTALTEQSGELDTLAVISIDGTRAGVCHNAEEAQTLLDRVKRLYTTQADSSADFVQQVHVDSVVAESRLAGEPQTVFETLSDRLDVRARRSVTYTETIPFGTVTRENDAEYQDYRETVRQGQTGEAVVTAEIQTLDGEENERTIVARTVLRSASDEIVEVGTKNIGIGTGSFVRPVSGYTFTSAFKWRWGRLHSGVDLAVPEGTPVRASDNGKVILAENSGDGYGNYIILDHGNGFKTLYGHNSALCVSVGDIVSQGDLIAYSGSTGNSTGPHLHFEIHLDDEKVDPERFLSF